MILSSGTWSLLGIETKTPYVSEKARVANFTNEGGYDYRYRFLKNIMGLWIIQEVSRNLGHQYSFAKLVEEARRDPFDGIFDVNDDRFLKPSLACSESCLHVSLSFFFLFIPLPIRSNGMVVCDISYNRF